MIQSKYNRTIILSWRALSTQQIVAQCAWTDGCVSCVWVDEKMLGGDFSVCWIYETLLIEQFWTYQQSIKVKMWISILNLKLFLFAKSAKHVCISSHQTNEKFEDVPLSSEFCILSVTWSGWCIVELGTFSLVL